MSLHYGHFKCTCTVLFLKIPENFLNSLSLLGKGSFGSVYELSHKGRNYAVKALNDKTQTIRGVSPDFYKEFFLSCLADTLGVGPKVTDIMGYDLVVTQNEMFFCMEKCESHISNTHRITEDLRLCLNKMHEVGLVHLDIKVENIAFSRTQNRFVFIDFGLSRLIAQKRGHKTLTQFVGTLSYCSPEMRKCYILQDKFLVDLYDNDEYALNKSF